MAGQGKIKGSAPKVRNANRGPGYWVGLARSRDNRERSLPNRAAHQGISYPRMGDVGSAAYRRRKGGR